MNPFRRTNAHRQDALPRYEEFVLPHPNPATAVQVQENRRRLLEDRDGYQRTLNWVFIVVVVLIAVAGAAGSIHNITDAARHYGRSPWIGWTSWAGAEGALIIAAAVSVAASWRGQVTPLWSRAAMWAAAGYAAYLNISRPGSISAGETALLIGAPLGTALGVEGMAWNARSLLLMLTGAEQHQAEVAQRRKLVRAHRWASRAHTWETKTVRGGIARWRARNYADEMAVDDPAVIGEMRANLTAFIAADSFRPTLPVQVELHHPDAPSHDALPDTRPAPIAGPLEHPTLPLGPVANTAALPPLRALIPSPPANPTARIAPLTTYAAHDKQPTGREEVTARIPTDDLLEEDVSECEEVVQVLPQAPAPEVGQDASEGAPADESTNTKVAPGGNREADRRDPLAEHRARVAEETAAKRQAIREKWEAAKAENPELSKAAFTRMTSWSDREVYAALRGTTQN